MQVDQEDDGLDFDDLLAQSDVALHPQAQAVEEELEAAKRKRLLVVPTNDVDVRKQLRVLGEPVTLFGERPGDRRDRLRDITSKLKEEQRAARGGLDEEPAESDDSSSSDSEREEEFYTPGGADLLRERHFIAQYSLKRARKRIARQKVEADLPLGTLLSARKAVFAELKTYTTLGTQLADDRGIALTRFSPNSSLLLTGSWSGAAKIWDVPNARCLGVYKGHGVSRIGGVAWHPQASLSQSRSAMNFATSAEDGIINFWPLDKLQDPEAPTSTAQPEAILQPLATLSGHAGMVRRIAFHPSGRTLASAGYDETWRLWDVEKQSELLIQEGHSKSVYAVAFQSDGSLLCSGGADAIGRVWDLRSGKTVMILDGHVNDILAIDFAPNGHQIATGSSDDTARIWDMRTLRSIYTIAAHAKNVSDLCFFRSDSGTFPFTLSARGLPVKAEVKAEPDALNGDIEMNGDVKPEVKLEEEETAPERENRQAGQDALNRNAETSAKPPLDGMYLVTAGYDSTVKFWSADDWQLIKTVGMEKGSRVMSVDLSQDGKFMAAGEFGRTFKLIAASGVQL